MGTGLLVALHMLVEFGAPSIMRYQTFTTAIYQQFELEFSNANAAMLSALLLALCMLMMGMELRLRGRGFARTGQGVARRTAPVRLGLWDWPIQALLVALVVVGSGTPLAMLGFWIHEGSSAAFPLMDILRTLGSSLYLSFGGALISCLLALPVGLVVVRYHGRLARLAERLPFLLHALPGLVIALSWCSSPWVMRRRCTRPRCCCWWPMPCCSCRWPSRPSAWHWRRPRRSWRRPRAPSADAAQGLLPGDPADHLPGHRRRLRAGVPRLHEGADGHPDPRPHRAGHPGHRRVVAHRQPGIRRCRAHAALIVLVSGLPVYLLTTRAYLGRNR